MCGRYTLTDPGDLLDELGVAPETQLDARYNVAPTQHMPAVRAHPGTGERELTFLRWGLIPFWAKDMAIGNRMINARSETAAEKPSFRNALKQRRCLLPADGFYEWKKIGGGKQPYYIHLEDRQPFVFAGLWEHWSKGPEGPIESYTILTTEPNDRVAELHNRMPVILPRENWDLWLDPDVRDPAALTSVLRPYPAKEIEFEPVSKMVNRPTNDLPQCVEPIQL